MKAAPKQANNDSNRSVTNASQSSWQNQLAQVSNDSKGAVAQRTFIDGIKDSPRMLAQRRQIEGYLGSGYPQTNAPVQPTSQINPQQTLQRSEKLDDEEKNPLQGKFAMQATAQLKQQTASQPNNTGLPDNLKSGIESLSGISMDNVKVHYNSPQPAQLNALAYAQGTDIHIAPGQGKHLSHEAWHVVQQAQGRVKPTMQMKTGVLINDDQGLEQEANEMGNLAMQTKQVHDARPDSDLPLATGQDVFSRQGADQPGSREGRDLIALHVAQRNGRTLQKQRTYNQIASAYLGQRIIQRHHTLPLTDTTLVNAIIYLVFEKVNPGPKGSNEDKKNDIVRYAGQTCEGTGIAARFTAHMNSGLHKNWSHQTHWICSEREGNWTRFETTCLEQAHIEAYWGSLENRQNALTQKKFYLYADNTTYRSKVKSLLGSKWEPHQ